MKKIILFLFCFIGLRLFSQIPYETVLTNNTPLTTGPTILSANKFTTGDPYSVTGNGNITLKAASEIRMIPNTNISGLTASGQFRAQIDTINMLEVVSYHPAGFSQIPLYDKFELGLKLPAAITNRVDDFFGDYMQDAGGGHHGYGSDYNQGANYPNNINPYDPDHISVEATFSFPGKPSQTIYGFYYRDFTYSSGDPNVVTPTYATTKWMEDLNLKYHWRVRFAPKYIGTYTVKWKITTNAGMTVVYEDNIGQTFSTISSNSLGFLKIGTNGKFLVTQPDESQPQKTIIPIGVVESYPIIQSPKNSIDPCPLNDALTSGSHDVFCPSQFWRHREKLQTRIADQGANLVRVFGTNYGYDIEWEHAGIYDSDKMRPLQNGVTVQNAIAAEVVWGIGLGPDHGKPYPSTYKGTSRQAIMWEFDRLLDMAKTNNLYIQWVIDNMENGYTANHPDPNPNNPDIIGDWNTKNPYRDILNTGRNPNSVEQFFTDDNAKYMYQNKLRYIIARYGYSTNIAAFELFNELHFLKCQMGGGTVLNTKFKPWLETMLEYIKSPSYLNHSDHLFTVSYDDWSGKCDGSSIGEQSGGNLIGSLQKLDFTSSHPYTWGNNSFEAAFVQSAHSTTAYGKPGQAGELGIYAGWEGRYEYPELMNPTFHTLLWSTTFIGGLTSGLEMWAGSGVKINPLEPTNYKCGAGFIQHFKPIQAFIKDINFDQFNYVPKYYKSEPLETFYLIENYGSSADHAIGYVRNRTFWWQNFTNNQSGYFYDQNFADTNIFKPGHGVVIPSNQPVLSGFFGHFVVEGLKQNTWYTIDWYNTYLDPAVSNPFMYSDSFLSNSSGNGIIVPPGFSYTSCDGHEFGFKIRRWDLALRLAFSNESGNSLVSDVEKEIQVMDKDMKIYPNPTSDKIYISYDQEKFKASSLTLYDLSGRLILTQNNTKELNTTNLENGAYLVKFSSENFVKTFKINVMH